MFPFIYLGFLSMVTAFATVTASAMKKVFDIFWRSQWLFSGSLVMPAREASGSSLYSDEDGGTVVAVNKHIDQLLIIIFCLGF